MDCYVGSLKKIIDSKFPTSERLLNTTLNRKSTHKNVSAHSYIFIILLLVPLLLHLYRGR